MTWLARVGLALLAVALAPVAAGSDPGASAAPATPGSPSALDACDAAVRDRPDELDSYSCYWSTARRERAWDEAARRLYALLAIRPGDHRAMLYLGAIEADRNRDRAEPLYRGAIDRFVAERDHLGEVYARVSLTMFLQARARHEEAEAELVAAEAAALASGDATLIARTRTRRGWQAYHRGDYGRAWILFRRAQETVFPEGPADVQAQVLDGLGATAWATGENRFGLDCYLREAEILERAGDRAWEASVRANIALLASQPGVSRSIGLDEVRELSQRALKAALRSGNRGAEVAARRYLGQTLRFPENLAELERALALARELGAAAPICNALNDLSFALAKGRPESGRRAVALSDEAIELARSRGGPVELARALAVRFSVDRLVAGREEAIASGLAALDAAERVRELQPDSSVRVATFARWAPLYYRLAHYVLESGDAAGREAQIDLALGVIERMRARVLLDTLDAAGASEIGDPDLPARSSREQKLEEISAVQRRLLDAGLDEQERSAALAELERLELEERALRDQIARADPAFARLRAPAVPGLAEIRRFLEENEALLSFQINDGAAGPVARGVVRPWLLLVTSGSVRTYPLPAREKIQLAAHMFLGLLERRDGSEERGAIGLYRMLFEQALKDLPPGVERLVVVPDRDLHGLPLGALRSQAAAEPLGARFEISRVPSATIWLRWRREPAPLPPRGVLVLADPELPAPPQADADRRSAGAFAAFLGLGPLPHARTEAREVADRLGGESRVAVAARASERLLKSEAGRGYRLLHVAAHAVSDDRQPSRSALVLAPGGDEEDGLLQPREIVELELDGTVVFLSACSSASGPVVAGEGLMGLARAFFQAGAPAVIGTLSPLRDDEAAGLAGDLSRHLADGKSLGRALVETRADWIEAGRPAAAWAGLVLIGSGDLAPFGEGGTLPGRGAAYLAALAALLVAGLLIGLLIRSARRRRAKSV